MALNGEDMPVFIERSADYEHIIPQTDCTCAKIFGTRTASISYRLAEDDVIEIRCELKICGAVFRKQSKHRKSVNVLRINLYLPKIVR